MMKLQRWGNLAVLTGRSGRGERAVALRGLDGRAGARRNELEGGLVVAHLGHVRAVMLARLAVILAFERHAVALLHISVLRRGGDGRKREGGRERGRQRKGQVTIVLA